MWSKFNGRIKLRWTWTKKGWVKRRRNWINQRTAITVSTKIRVVTLFVAFIDIVYYREHTFNIYIWHKSRFCGLLLFSMGNIESINKSSPSFNAHTHKYTGEKKKEFWLSFLSADGLLPHSHQWSQIFKLFGVNCEIFELDHVFIWDIICWIKESFSIGIGFPYWIWIHNLKGEILFFLLKITWFQDKFNLRISNL